MKITKPIFKVIIAGGRDFSNYELLQEKCNHLLRNKLLTHNVEIVSGCARGADALIAFWDGKSKGTKHMIDLADKYKLFVRIIHY